MKVGFGDTAMWVMLVGRLNRLIYPPSSVMVMFDVSGLVMVMVEEEDAGELLMVKADEA